MILWQYLVERADADAVDTDRTAAREFWRSLPIVDRGRFNWREWRDNFAALRWFADQRIARGRISKPMPSDVDAVLTRNFSRMQVGIVRWGNRPGWNVEFKIKLTRKDGRLARRNVEAQFDDTDVFWQAVFLSFFAPEHVSRMSFCGWCGKPLESPKVKLCPTCRMRKSRAEDPEHYREYERERKRAERSELAKRKGKQK